MALPLKGKDRQGHFSTCVEVQNLSQQLVAAHSTGLSTNVCALEEMYKLSAVRPGFSEALGWELKLRK